MLPELDVARIRRWVGQRNDRVPEDARSQIRYELDMDDRSVTLVECRPPWREDYGPEWTRFPIARLRYTKSRKEWALYWRDRKHTFHAYDLAAPTADVQELLDEVEGDRTGIFWG